MLYRINLIFRVLFHPFGGIRYLFSNYRSLSSFTILSRLYTICPKISFIVDVGANKGQFARASALFFNQAKVYSFEPVPAVSKQLVRNTRDCETITIYNFGLGSEEGVIDFYQNEHLHASSALPVSAYQKESIPETANTTTIQVPIKRLDSVAAAWGKLPGPVLLKLDVQGYEKQVLEGSLGFLGQVDYLLFEASFISMYEGEPLFEEMHDYVQSLGFSLLGPIGLLQDGEGRISQMDMLYKRIK